MALDDKTLDPDTYSGEFGEVSCAFKSKVSWFRPLFLTRTWGPPLIVRSEPPLVPEPKEAEISTTF